jgi:DNA-binding response OmpR family regulator/DNA-binding CsgD family transcriptional regulator
VTTPDQTSTVLAVDDTPANLGVVFQILRDAAYKVLLAQNGASALSLMTETRPDIVLLDVQLPGMDGFEICRRIKANPDTADIPVLFLTVSDDPAAKVRGFDVGGVDYLTKPIEPAELLARLNTHLTLRNLQRQLREQRQQLEQQLIERTSALEVALAQQRMLQQEVQRLRELSAAQSEQVQQLLQGLLAERGQQQSHPDTLAQQMLPGLASLRAMLTDLLANYTPAPEGEVHRRRVEVLRIVSDLERRITQHVPPVSPASAEVFVRDHPLVQLSAREQEVLQLLAVGKETGEIAELLGVADNTVRVYRSRLMNKLDLHDLPSLVKFALRHQLISLD